MAVKLFFLKPKLARVFDVRLQTIMGKMFTYTGPYILVHVQI